MKNLLKVRLTCIQEGQIYCGYIKLDENKIVHFIWQNNFSALDILLHYLRIHDILTNMEIYHSENGNLVDFRTNAMVYKFLQDVIDAAIIIFHNEKKKEEFSMIRPHNVDDWTWEYFILNNSAL